MSMFVNKETPHELKVYFKEIYHDDRIIRFDKINKEDIKQGDKITRIVSLVFPPAGDDYLKIIEAAAIINNRTGEVLSRSSILYYSIILKYFVEWDIPSPFDDGIADISIEILSILHSSLIIGLAREWIKMMIGVGK